MEVGTERLYTTNPVVVTTVPDFPGVVPQEETWILIQTRNLDLN